jgi:hypothetical protein
MAAANTAVRRKPVTRDTALASATVPVARARPESSMAGSNSSSELAEPVAGFIYDTSPDWPAHL